MSYAMRNIAGNVAATLHDGYVVIDGIDFRKPDHFRPGKKAPFSAQWAAFDVHGDRIKGRQCTLSEGTQFPPVRGYKGATWGAPDRTRHVS